MVEVVVEVLLVVGELVVVVDAGVGAPVLKTRVTAAPTGTDVGFVVFLYVTFTIFPATTLVLETADDDGHWASMCNCTNWAVAVAQSSPTRLVGSTTINGPSETDTVMTAPELAKVFAAGLCDTMAFKGTLDE